LDGDDDRFAISAPTSVVGFCVGLRVGDKSDTTGACTVTVTPGIAASILLVSALVVVELCSVEVILDAVTSWEGFVTVAV
jgi:hypothetical protein